MVTPAAALADRRPAAAAALPNREDLAAERGDLAVQAALVQADAVPDDGAVPHGVVDQRCVTVMFV